MRAGVVLAVAGELAGAARDVAGIAYVGHHAPDGTTADDLRRLAVDVRGRLGAEPSVVAVATVAGDRPLVVVAVSEPARQRGIKAGELVRAAAAVLGGGGGGKDDLAQGGGTDPAAIGPALEAIERLVGEQR
jgi:alanyl-tRNA synthetase